MSEGLGENYCYACMTRHGLGEVCPAFKTQDLGFNLPPPITDEISKKRWEKTHEAKDLQPIEALKAMIRDIEAGTCNPGHLLIIYTNKDPEISGTGWYQAGNLSHYEQVGLCTETARILGKHFHDD